MIFLLHKGQLSWLDLYGKAVVLSKVNPSGFVSLYTRSVSVILMNLYSIHLANILYPYNVTYVAFRISLTKYFEIMC